MIQVNGTFTYVIFWEFAKSIRIGVFICSYFLATDWLAIASRCGSRVAGKPIV
ncbi:hypothetical protein [Leptolyngbya ohadii]|uniref:hypothetical protein n=1 Tax=Leptolyngbya ohadii TaxID=1962290 RepID=UPI0015C5E86F|nr:hypothetical protein [Leptolyngbya ohadii]